MNEINKNGIYTVYVDAYEDTETNVTVTLFIRGAQVGQVNCGSMVSSDSVAPLTSATDSCRVGTINWTGGTNGNGTFTPDGAKAIDF